MARFSHEDRIFLDLFDQSPIAAIDCVAPMDVVETGEAIQVVLDVPGVAAADLRIVFADGDLTIAGRKPPCASARASTRFHLAERTFGRFTRTLTLEGAFDAGRASATLSAGELRITLPRIEERRGRPIVIPLTVPQAG